VILSTTLPHSCGKRREPTQRFPRTRYNLRMATPRAMRFRGDGLATLKVPTVRYHKTETNSMSRRGSMWQLGNQKEHNILDARICLPQPLLGAEVCGGRMRESRKRTPEVWLVCQRSVTTADGCRTGSECPMMSALLVYIAGGFGKFGRTLSWN